MKRVWATLVFVIAFAYGILLLYDRPPATPGGWLRAAGLEERFTRLAGHRVRYVRTGSGPSVLLLHGFGSSLYTWKDVIPVLAAEHDVLALDFPGFGWSDQPPDLSFDLYPRVVIALLDELGVARASLVGNSLGGAVAALVAAEHPGRVERLVLIDAAGFNLLPAERPALVRLTAHPLAEWLLRVLPLRRLVVEQGLSQVLHDHKQLTSERLEEYLAAASRPGTLASIRSLSASPLPGPQAFEAALRDIVAPTLVIWGSEDSWIPPGHSDRFVAAIAGARKVLLPGVGHVPEEEDPRAVNGLLREFLGAGPS